MALKGISGVFLQTEPSPRIFFIGMEMVDMLRANRVIGLDTETNITLMDIEEIIHTIMVLLNDNINENGWIGDIDGSVGDY